MVDLQTVSEQIRKIRPQLAERFGVSRIGIFGSVARGEQNENSDIDVLIDVNHQYSLMELAGILNYLEDELKHPVDIADIRHLRKEFSRKIEQEVVFL